MHAEKTQGRNQHEAENQHVRLQIRDSKRAKVHVHEQRLNNSRIAKQEQHGRTLQGK